MKMHTAKNNNSIKKDEPDDKKIEQNEIANNSNESEKNSTTVPNGNYSR